MTLVLTMSSACIHVIPTAVREIRKHLEQVKMVGTPPLGKRSARIIHIPSALRDTCYLLGRFF